jgi:pantoate kinase
VSAHTKVKSWVEFESKWPFQIRIEPDIVRMDRVALSSQQKTLDDLRAAVGFKHSERQAIIEAIKKQEANAELIAEAFNVATETGLTPRQLADALNELRSYFTSGNDVPVERSTILAKDFWRIVNRATGATP